MVVHKKMEVDPSRLDLGYLGLFLGLRVNELVTESLVSAGFQHVKQSHGYVIQHLMEQDRTITELANRMEVTQQAASKVVAEMTRLGIVELIIAEDRRAKQVRISKHGWQSVKLARKKRRRIEARLMKKIGKDYDGAKTILLKCLAELGGLRRIESRRVREPR